MIRTAKELKDSIAEGYVLKVCDGVAAMVPIPKRHPVTRDRKPAPVIVSDELTKQLLAPDFKWNRDNHDYAIAQLTRDTENNKVGWKELGLDGSGDYYLLVQ